MYQFNSMFVDLGLPSGTKWAKCNYGANSDTKNGGYYTWDEAMKLPITLPTKEQFQELYDNTTSVWIENYKGSGVSGRLFVSKINGNAIFFLASGYFDGTSLHYRGSYGYYWSSSLNSSNPCNAHNLLFDSSGVSPQSNYYRFRGRSVRGVLVSE